MDSFLFLEHDEKNVDSGNMSDGHRFHLCTCAASRCGGGCGSGNACAHRCGMHGEVPPHVDWQACGIVRKPDLRGREGPSGGYVAVVQGQHREALLS